MSAQHSDAGARADFEAQVQVLNLVLPDPFPAAGEYVNAVRTGSLLVLGGHIPITVDGQLIVGRLGEDLDVAAGRAAARLAALSALATLRHELGSLDRVRQIVSVRGVVNATPDFAQHTQVIDGASEVFVQVFGDCGRHARLAVGVASLPADLALEIELLAEVRQTAPSESQ
ncbi:RidA family protein [Nocardia colli]|uniref:RidA family protein n=1 Tax=Nocardia colli TaxID=2545717 RepID=A0A5N0E9V9_9NOCA|nr:RidA family protein [Nocardia colli]KAA8886217.1 RidA family protein [Nocardia colli]